MMPKENLEVRKLQAKKLAVLADIHGNSVALQAVLADLEAQGGADYIIDIIGNKHQLSVLNRLKEGRG